MATKKSRKAQNKKIEQKKYGLYILCITIFLLPLFRGLFFEKEFYTASILIALLTAGAMIKSMIAKEKVVFSTWLEYLFAGMIVLYISTFPFAVNKQTAIFEAIKNVTYFLIFIIVVDQVKGRDEITTISWTILLSSALVSIIGIGAAFGSITYPDAFKEGMISSTFQYHNTFGAYMLAALFLAMGEIISNEGWKKHAATAIGYVLLLGLVFSYSRGAWLFFPVVGFIALVLMKKESLKDIIFALIAIVVSFGITTSQIYKAIQTSNQAMGWIWLFLGITATIGIVYFLHQYLVGFYTRHLSKKRLLVSICIIGVLFLGLLSNGHVVRLLPETVSSRVTTISTKTFTVVERGVFYQDALKVIKDYPIIGTGGGGWATLYSQYKAYDYTSTEVHNNIMQAWIETGTIGLVLLLGIYICFIGMSYKIIKGQEDKKLKNKITGIICTALAMMFHNTIDFNMSLGAFAVVFWTLIATVTAAYKIYMPQTPKANITLDIPRTAIIILAMITLLASVSFRLGISNVTTAISLAEEGHFYEAKEHFERASRQHPYHASYPLDLAQIQLLIGASTSDQTLVKKSKKNIEKALSLNSRSIAVLQNAINYYGRREEYDRVVELVEKYTKTHPLSDHTYNFSIDIYYTIGNIQLDAGDSNKARMYFEKILVLEQRIEEINEELFQRKESILKDVHDIPERYVNQRFQINLNQDIVEKVSIVKEKAQ